MIDLLRTTALRQLHELVPAIRLVVIHPNYFPQHLLLSVAFEDAHTVYVRFSGERVGSAQLRQQLEDALHVQTGAARLDGVNRLLLDECDRADPLAFDAFLPQLLSDFRGQRVFIVSRFVPQSVVANEDVRAVTHFVPVDDTLMLWDYARRDPSTVLLEVRAFGSGRVFVNGRLVENWDGLLPRSLFFYLVDRGMTTRNEIFATFWPTLSVREATNVFHVTKRKISEVLGCDLTIYWSGFYRIAPNIHLSYDAIQLTEMVQNSAVESLERSRELLRRAIALYRGDFLTSLDSDWVRKRREELLQTYVDALIGLARLMERTDEHRQALGLYLRAAVSMPHREDLASSIMHLYHSLGMPADALETYARLEKDLNTALGISPAPTLREFAASLRKQLSS